MTFLIGDHRVERAELSRVVLDVPTGSCSPSVEHGTVLGIKFVLDVLVNIV